MNLCAILTKRQRAASLRDAAHPNAVNHCNEQQRKQPAEHIPKPRALLNVPTEFHRMGVQFLEQHWLIHPWQSRRLDRYLIGRLGMRSIALKNPNQLAFSDLYVG